MNELVFHSFPQGIDSICEPQCHSHRENKKSQRLSVSFVALEHLENHWRGHSKQIATFVVSFAGPGLTTQHNVLSTTCFSKIQQYRLAAANPKLCPIAATDDH